MKFLKSLAVFLCLSVAAFSQNADVQVPSSGSAAIIIGTNIAWSGVNNNYILNTNPNTGICVMVSNNNPTNPHTFSLAIQGSSDPNAKGPVTDFAATNKWQPAFSMQGNDTLNPLANIGSSAYYFANTVGAVRVAIGFSGAVTVAGTPDTTNIVAVQANGCPGNVLLTSGIGQGSSPRGLGLALDGVFGPKPFPNCDFSQFANVGSGTSVAIVSANSNPATGTFHVCSFQISGVVTAAAALFEIGYGGTFNTCAAINDLWVVSIANTTVPNYSMSGLNLIAGPGKALCVKNNGTASTVMINIAYAYY
jgi:hypothetical protein